jgi:adenylate cyclase
MADLSGYTAMTDVHGGVSAAKIVGKYLELVDKSISGQSKIVQRIGDQVVMISDHAEDLANTILKLNGYISQENHFLSIHAGLHFGPIHYANENLFGSTINVASRIMNLAGRSQVLCSSTFVKAIDSDLYSFSSVGKFKFRNVLKEVEIFELVNTSAPTFPVDPVCHMQIAEGSRFMFQWSGTTFYFCSQQCRNIFEADPHAFLKTSEL